MKLLGFRILVDTVNAKDHMFIRLRWGPDFGLCHRKRFSTGSTLKTLSLLKMLGSFTLNESSSKTR